MSTTPFTYGEYVYQNHNETHPQQRRHFHNPDNIGFNPDQIAIAIAAQQLLASLAAQKLLLLPPAEAKSMVSMDGFKVCMDVHQFQPNEITVKIIDSLLVIEGKQEERPDEYGFITRQFIRKFILPNGYEPMQVASTLSSDGVLTIKCPPPNPKLPQKDEHIVQIQQVGPALQTEKKSQNSNENKYKK